MLRDCKHKGKSWKSNLCYRQAIGCCRERGLQDQQAPRTTGHTNFSKYSTVSVMGNEPSCFFPDCSQNDEGNVQRQAVKVPWHFSPGAPVLPILQRWGPWMTLLNHRFSLCVLGWLTNPAVSSTFFWFTPCNKEVTTGSLPTRANRSAISSALTTKTPCFSTIVGQYHLVPLPRPPSP